MLARLTTSDGGHVALVEIPPFKKLPDVLFWGERTFLLACPEDATGEPRYAEGFCFYIPTSAARDLSPCAPAGVKSQPATDPPPPVDRTQRESTSGRVVNPGSPAPDPELDAKGMHKGYWVLTEEERAKGFVRPVRRSYIHTICGSKTTMGEAIAETYARDPGFYGETYCANCQQHFPVGGNGQFVWADDPKQKVGT